MDRDCSDSRTGEGEPKGDAEGALRRGQRPRKPLDTTLGGETYPFGC